MGKEKKAKHTTLIDEDDIQDLSEDVDDDDGAGEDDGGDDATDAIAAAPAGLRKVRFIQRPQQ